jgi:hypothetical protein
LLSVSKDYSKERNRIILIDLHQPHNFARQSFVSGYPRHRHRRQDCGHRIIFLSRVGYLQPMFVFLLEHTISWKLHDPGLSFSQKVS